MSAGGLRGVRRTSAEGRETGDGEEDKAPDGGPGTESGEKVEREVVQEITLCVSQT